MAGIPFALQEGAQSLVAAPSRDDPVAFKDIPLERERTKPLLPSLSNGVHSNVLDERALPIRNSARKTRNPSSTSTNASAEGLFLLPPAVHGKMTFLSLRISLNEIPPSQFLQKGDGFLHILITFCNQVLQAMVQNRFERHFITGFRFQNVGHCSKDALPLLLDLLFLEEDRPYPSEWLKSWNFEGEVP